MEKEESSNGVLRTRTLVGKVRWGKDVGEDAEKTGAKERYPRNCGSADRLTTSVELGMEG